MASKGVGFKKYDRRDMFQSFFGFDQGEIRRVRKRRNHMMQFIIGIAVTVSPWLSVLVAALSGSLRIEYKKYSMRLFPLFSALIISIAAYCTYNAAFGDFGILTVFLRNIGGRPLSAYRMDDIVSAIGPFNWMFYIIAKCKDYALLCMMPGFIIYYLYGKITAQVCEEIKCPYRDFIRVYVIGILLLQFFTVLEHGRFIMAGCIVLYAVYRELYLGKKDIWGVMLYILPLCFHLGILPLYAFRVCVRFFSKSRLLWFLAIAFAYVIIMYSGSFFSFLPYSIMNYIEKARVFFQGGSDWGQYVFTSRFYILLRMVFDAAFILILVFLVMIIRSRRFRSDEKTTDRKVMFLYFIMQLVFFSLITNLIVSEAFWRFGTLLFFLVPFLLVYTKKYLPFFKYQIFQYSITGLGFVITMMHIAMVVKNSILPYGDFICRAGSFHLLSILFEDLTAVFH